MGRTSKKADIDLAAAARRWRERNTDGRKPTIQDVADLAGVSKKTVSRIINNSPSVNEATRDAIQSLILEIGYRPDPQARGLASKRSFLVGLITDNPTPQYVVNIQQGILDVIRQTGYELVVHPCDRKSDTFLEDALRFIEVQKLYGVILTPSVSEDENLAEVLRSAGCAYIRIASIALDMESRMIVTNDRVGGKHLANHLVGLGHKRIAWVEGRRSFRSSTERIAGFKEGLADHGISVPDHYQLRGDYTFESGIAIGADLLDLQPPPTAVFAANDEMAAGVTMAALRRNLVVPDDISIAGFDDSPISTMIWPPLTTIRQPIQAISQKAISLLINDLREIENEDANPTLPFDLIVRGSTAPHQ